MLTIILLLIVFGVAYVAGARRAEPSASPPGVAASWRSLVGRVMAPDRDLLARSGGPRRAVLTTAMLRSLADPSNARASDGAIHVEPGGYEVVCSERDAAVVQASPASFAGDLNALIAQERNRLGLSCAGPVEIHRVTVDDRHPDDVPLLRPLPKPARRAARPHPSDLPTPVMRVAAVSPVPPTEPLVDRSPTARLVPRTEGLRPVPIGDREQRLGRNPRHGAGLVAVATVSWDHAAVAPAAGHDGWEIRDLRSRHGTRVNGRDVCGGGTRPLAHGDLVELGPDAAFTWTTGGSHALRTGT